MDGVHLGVRVNIWASHTQCFASHPVSFPLPLRTQHPYGKKDPSWHAYTVYDSIGSSNCPSGWG